MTRTQNIDPRYLIGGAFIFVFIIIYIIVCIYCFRMKQIREEKDAYNRNMHKSLWKTSKRGKKKSKTKRGVYKAGARFSIKTSSKGGSRVSPIPSGASQGVAVPMTIDSIATISGENLLAGDQGFKESNKDKKRDF